jgi:hypothetical protein
MKSVPRKAYRVGLTERAARNLRRIYRTINAGCRMPGRTHDWFNGFEKAACNLDKHAAREPVTFEDDSLRHLSYGRKPNLQRIIYAIDERNRVVSVLHIRQGARMAFTPSRDD